MATTQMSKVIIMMIAFTVTMTAVAGIQEVCQWETFEAKCQEDEVILMKDAHYGRMRFGRCQQHKYFVGCSADVSAIMHARCSGRQHCSVPVPDPVLFAASPCNKDLVSYLEADYECIKVARSNPDKCDDKILTALNGDIAKPLINTKTSVCPHRILSQPGQTVNVYLYDFYNKDSNTEVTPECITYGHVSEGNNTPTKICGGEFKKNHLIYSSDSNIVDITLTEGSSHSHHYLIHYEVVGCPTLQAPPNSWVKIQDNTAVVMCNFSHISSNLVCSDNEWVGDVQNCTNFNADLLSPNALSVFSFGDIFANSSVFPIVCVAFTIFFSIGVLMLVKVLRMKTKQIPELPQASPIEKPSLPKNEKSFMAVDQYQSVYVPITMDSHSQYAPVHQNNLYEAPRAGALSTLQSFRPAVIENTYGPLNHGHVAPANTCSHSVYNITELTLGEDNIINMEGTILN